MLRSIVIRRVHLAQLVSLLHLSITVFAIDFQMIPGGEQRVVNEGVFNITCQLTLTQFDRHEATSVIDGNVTWDLPNVYSENNLIVCTFFHYSKYCMLRSLCSI